MASLAATASLDQLAAQKSGRYLLWVTQSVSGTVATSFPTGTDGANVSDSQLAKICVDINGNATASLAVNFRYTGRDIYNRIDQSGRDSIVYNWTQQVDVSGVDYAHVQLLTLTTGSGGGSVDIYFAKSISTGSA